MSEGEYHLENSKLVDTDTNAYPLDTLARDTNTESLGAYAKDTDTDRSESLAWDTDTDHLQTLGEDTNTDPIDVRKVQLSLTATNSDAEVVATLTEKCVKSVDVRDADARDRVLIPIISTEDDDCLDTKVLSSVSSRLDEESYDPIPNENEVNNTSNQAHHLVQDPPLLENPVLKAESKSKSLENEHVEKESKPLKPTLSRCERSRLSFPQKAIQKNPGNRMINRFKKNVEHESYKKNVSSPSKLVNGLLEDSHIKTHPNIERETQKEFVQESWEDSLFQKGTICSKESPSNASNEQCKSHKFHTCIDAFQKKRVVDDKIKISSVSNFQSKLSNKHCKSHQLESSKLEGEMLPLKTPKSQFPWTKATLILKAIKIKVAIKKRKSKQVKRPAPLSKSPRSNLLESPQTLKCVRKRNPTPPTTGHYLNPKGLKPRKAYSYKSNAKHPQPWIMPSPNMHYDDIEIDSLPLAPRYCSRDKDPLQRSIQKYSPKLQLNKSITKSNNSSSQPCFGMPCANASNPKENIIKNKKIADFIVQDLPPLKLSKKSKSPHRALPSISPLSSSPFTTPKKIHTLLPTLKNDKAQQCQVELNQVVKTNNLNDNKPSMDSTSFANVNEDTIERIKSKDTMSKCVETSLRISSTFERMNNSNPYACEYHDYSPKNLDHILPPTIIKRSTSQTENLNNKKRSKCNCCGKKMESKKVKKEHEKNIINENTITTMEGEKNITKRKKEKSIKFNVAVISRKQTLKILHKIKILMQRSKTSPKKDKSKDLSRNQDEVQNENNKPNRCFGSSKLKSKVDDKISSTIETSSIYKNDEVPRINLSEERIESNASIS